MIKHFGCNIRKSDRNKLNKVNYAITDNRKSSKPFEIINKDAYYVKQVEDKYGLKSCDFTNYHINEVYENKLKDIIYFDSQLINSYIQQLDNDEHFVLEYTLDNNVPNVFRCYLLRLFSFTYKANKDRLVEISKIPYYFYYDFYSFAMPIYTDQHIFKLQKEAMDNYDLNMRYMSLLEEDEFNSEFSSFLKKYPGFTEVYDISVFDGKTGVYIMVLDEYKQIYVGISNTNIKLRIQQHWYGKTKIDRLVSGGKNSIININSFGPLDTTRIFIYENPNKKCEELENEILDIKSLKKFMLNRTDGGIKDLVGSVKKLRKRNNDFPNVELEIYRSMSNEEKLDLNNVISGTMSLVNFAKKYNLYNEQSDEINKEYIIERVKLIRKYGVLDIVHMHEKQLKELRGDVQEKISDLSFEKLNSVLNLLDELE